METHPLTVAPDSKQSLWSNALERVSERTLRQRLLWGVVIASFALRLSVAGLSEGTNDIRHWQHYAGYIALNGLPDIYRNVPFFNHPPLMGLLSVACLEASTLFGIPFSFVFKLPVIASEVLTTALLWSIWRKSGGLAAAKIIALFATNLVSILLSAYHGNTDCLCAMLCLASAYALSQKSWSWAGLALGAAINVKLVPVMLIPVFVLLLPSWKSAFRFTRSLALCALPFVPVALVAWPEFSKNVLGYNSMGFNWGVILIAHEAQRTLPKFTSWIHQDYVPLARYVILAFMFGIGALWRYKRRFDAFEAGAVALSVMLVLLPGFGIQYLAWPLPLLFATNPRRATSYGIVGGAFALLVYYLYSNGAERWYSAFSAAWFPSPSHLPGFLTWGMLLGFSVESFQRVLRLRASRFPHR